MSDATRFRCRSGRGDPISTSFNQGRSIGNSACKAGLWVMRRVWGESRRMRVATCRPFSISGSVLRPIGFYLSSLSLLLARKSGMAAASVAIAPAWKMIGVGM